MLGTSDLVGKTFVGYQGWFLCKGDGAPESQWRHWAASKVPTPNYQSFELYPDMREYEKVYDTGYKHLGNGERASLFSSYDESTITIHCRWMKEYGIDGCAIQRFGCELHSPMHKEIRNTVTSYIRKGNEKYGLKFYIMYDISGMNENNFVEMIKVDWEKCIVDELNITDSESYTRHQGQPVVCIWGMGFTDRPGSKEQCLELIRFFKEKDCYVIGGVPYNWLSSKEDSKKHFLEVYTKFDMISPWAVGRFKGIKEVAYQRRRLKEDKKFLDGLGKDYQPVIFPGFAWSNWNGGSRNHIPRLHGEFMWRQFAGIAQLEIKNAYIAMFDEYDEGTAIAKAAEDQSMCPIDQYFLTLDADNVKCSSDFYLRLTRDGINMLKKLIPLTFEHPTKHLE